MNARVAKLETLLGRIQRRGAEPRLAPSPLELSVHGAEPAQETPAPALPVPELELDEPGESVPPPADSNRQDSLLPESLDALDEVVIDEEPTSTPLMAEPARLTQPPGSVAEPSQLGVRTGPTLEQVGATVALDEGPTDGLELDEPLRDPTQPSSHPGARLEAELPQAARQSVKSVESTMQDLQRLRLGESTPVEARVSTRPVAATNVVDFVNAAKSFAPKSFLELLDASLNLK